MIIENKNSEKDSVFANVFCNELQIAYFNKNKLSYFNTFNIASKEDICYYLLTIYDQFSINANSTLLTISGNDLLYKDLNSLLLKYNHDHATHLIL